MKKIVFAIAALAFSCLTARAGEMSAQVLAELNLARTAPQTYARLLADRMPQSDRDVAEAIRFLEHARPLPPLASSTGLAMGAQLQVDAQGPTGGFGHGSSPFSRMSRYGQWIGPAGENISYGQHDARSVVIQLIVDHGVSNRGHRKNVFSTSYGVAGVACGGHATWGATKAWPACKTARGAKNGLPIRPPVRLVAGSPACLPKPPLSQPPRYPCPATGGSSSRSAGRR